jgi:hypothetical protein
MLPFLYLLASMHLMHCTMLISAHLYSYMLDHAEPKSEEPMEQAQVEDPANPELTQGKPQCILPIIPGFFKLLSLCYA